MAEKDKPRPQRFVSRPGRARRRGRSKSLDANRASATLLLSGERQIGPGLHADTESMADRPFLSVPLLDGVRIGACWMAGAWDISRLSSWPSAEASFVKTWASRASREMAT